MTDLELQSKAPPPKKCRGLGRSCVSRRLWGLAQADSALGASISASATLGALVGINAVDIAFGNCANGTFVDAGSTCYTVFANYVSHS